MSIALIMQACLATVPAALGQGGSYKRLTSSAAELGNRTYAAAVPVGGLLQARMMMQDYNPVGGAQVKHEMATLMVDFSVVLSLGDIWIDSSGTEWAVDGIADNGVGTTTYRLKRDIAQIAGPNRQGGV